MSGVLSRLLSISLILLLFTNCVICSSDEGLTSWDLIDTKLPSSTYLLFSVYNKHSNYPDCVWMFGGYTELDIYCFNIKNNTLKYWSKIDVANQYNARSGGGISSVLISNTNINIDGYNCNNNYNDFIYFITQDSILRIYDLNKKTMILLDNSDELRKKSFTYVRMTQNPLNLDELLIVDGGNRGLFSIYTISTNTFSYGQSLKTKRSYPAIIAINNQYSKSYPYLYVFEGYNTRNIERLDLSTNNTLNENWETVSTRPTSVCTSWSLSHRNAFLWNDKIYLVGGEYRHSSNYRWYSMSCVSSYNLIDGSWSKSVNFPTRNTKSAVTLVTDFVVVAGGSQINGGSDSQVNTIYISNDLGCGDENKYIFVNSNSLDWQQARNYCYYYYDTTLATIESYDDIIEALLSKKDEGFEDITKFYIGYYYDIFDRKWGWLDGTNNNYTYNFKIRDDQFCSIIHWQNNGLNEQQPIQRFETVECQSLEHNYFLCNNPC